ncbi:MAG: histidine phosphotransferase family protein [Pseudomonadota bacterium]
MNSELPIEDVDLCALIGSRICHDLVSPVGAIGNGVELLGMSGEPSTGPELSLISDSVGNAQARLRFYRVAFGQAGDDQDLGRTEVLTILTELYRGARLRVHWSVDEGRPRREVKLAFLLLLCLESAMPYGGQVHISRSRDGWRFQGDAEKMRADPALWEGLSAGTVPAPLRPSQVHFGLVPNVVRRLRGSLSVTRTESRIVMEF